VALALFGASAPATGPSTDGSTVAVTAAAADTSASVDSIDATTQPGPAPRAAAAVTPAEVVGTPAAALPLAGRFPAGLARRGPPAA